MAKTGEAKTDPRDYVVLRRLNEAGASNLEQVGIVKATSAGRAVDELREGKGGRWVAVPMRNWNEEDLDIVQREPTVKRKKVHPGQTELPVEQPVAA
jgi:hypothetical protein